MKNFKYTFSLFFRVSTTLLSFSLMPLTVLADDHIFGELEDKVIQEGQKAENTIKNRLDTEIQNTQTEVEKIIENVQDKVNNTEQDIKDVKDILDGGKESIKNAASEVLNEKLSSEADKKAQKAFEQEIKERAKGITTEAGQVTSSDSRPVIDAANSSKGKSLPNPWPGGWPGGINPQWKADWMADSSRAINSKKGSITTDKFMNCFEPKVIENSCIFCSPQRIRIYKSSTSCPKEDNSGEVWEYWWPEAEIELNAFGISAINAKELDNIEGLDRESLKRGLIERFKPELAKRLLEQIGIEVDVEEFDDLASSPLFSHNAVNDLGPVSNVSTEAHAYQTSIDKYGQENQPSSSKTRDKTAIVIPFPKQCIPIPAVFNGYKKTNECFYNTLNKPSKKVVHGFTEEDGLIDYWRFPERSNFVRSDLYQKARVAPIESNIADYINELKTKSGIEGGMEWLRNDTCASYRLTNFPVRFSSLSTLFNIKKRPFSMDEDPLKYQCYMEAELYPLTGSLPGDHPAHTSSAYLARKAIELISHRRDILAGERQRTPLSHFADWSESPITGLDKLQIVYPENEGSCFHMNEVSEKSDFFDKLRIKTDSTGSVRIVIWNKRTVCTCPYRGYLDPDSSVPAPFLKVTNDVSFYNFPPKAKGCMPYMCNPNDSIIDLPDQLKSILNDAQNNIKFFGSDPKKLIQESIKNFIYESGIIPTEEIQRFQADLENTRNQVSRGMSITDKPLEAVLDAKENELIQKGDVSSLIDSIKPLKIGETNSTKDIIAQINSVSDVSRQGEKSIETIIAYSMSQLEPNAENNKAGLVKTCSKVQNQVSSTKTTVKDAQIKAGQAADKLDREDKNLGKNIKNIDLNKLNIDQIINVCAQSMREAENFSASLNDALSGINEQGQKIVIESITSTFPDAEVSKWVFNSIEDIQNGNLDDNIQNITKNISEFTDSLNAKDRELLEKLEALKDQTTGRISGDISNMSDELKQRFEEAGIDPSQGLDQFVDLEALDIDLKEFDKFNDYLENINLEKLNQTYEKHFEKLTEKGFEKLEKYMEKISSGAGFGELQSYAAQFSSALSNYSNMCLHAPSILGDERIGTGDLPTGHEDAKIFSSESFFLGGSSTFPPFAESAEKVFPFGH